jgi:hypothetical protein
VKHRTFVLEQLCYIRNYCIQDKLGCIYKLWQKVVLIHCRKKENYNQEQKKSVEQIFCFHFTPPKYLANSSARSSEISRGLLTKETASTKLKPKMVIATFTDSVFTPGLVGLMVRVMVGQKVDMAFLLT